MKPKGKVKFINKEKSKFFSTVKKRVDIYFQEKQLSKKANKWMVVKSITLLSGYLLPFAVLLIFDPAFPLSIVIWLLMGISLAGIGMSVMHDANHGAYSDKSYVNLIMGHTLNLAGGSVTNWKLQHNILHHTYTNIVHMDDDIADKLVLRFSPHTKIKFIHQLQWAYALLFYGISSLYWVLVKDFLQFFRYIENGVNTNSKKANSILFIKLLADKFFYFSLMLVIPTLLFNIPFTQVLIGFITMHFVAGVIMTVVFQLAHTVEGTSYPLPDENGNIENEWAIAQLNSTVNFAPDNKLISWYIGGLNFQIEHHLFPAISHVHYPEIAKIVKSTAEEFNIPYLENKTIALALKSHFATLYRFGRLPNLNEAIV